MASKSTSSPRKQQQQQQQQQQSSGRLTPTTAGSNSTSRRPASPSKTTTTTSSPSTNRPRGPISARSAVKKPSMSSSTSLHLSPDEEDSRNESNSLLTDLRERLQQAEQTVLESKRQNEILQARLDDTVKDQAKMEERVHEDEERIEELENAKREVVKQKRELENIFEAERAAVMKDRDATAGREEELQSIIQRLKDSLAQKESTKTGYDSDLSRNGSFTGSSSPTLDANHFAPPSLARSNSSRNNSKLLLQKDKLIEELRLELAELQIKLMELENKGGGRLQDLEKALIEARVTNARLMEENESFQTLLMEKTLNGDFSSKTAVESDNGAGASLADELASVAEDDGEGEQQPRPSSAERTRRLEIEVERQKAENKALTLYINRIIERILQHQGGFETILSNNDEEPAADPTAPTALPPLPAPTPINKDKDLPPPPPPPSSTTEDEAPSLLQRAKSIAWRPRPQSVIGPSPSTKPATLTEDPETAPRIPIARNQSQRHSMALPRRVNTSGEYNPSAASIVNTMYRGPQQDDISSPRSSLIFHRMPSHSRPAPTSTPTPSNTANEDSEADSIDGSDSARKAALDALNGTGPADVTSSPSPPRSLGAGSTKDDKQQQVFTGNKIRPLRLVQEESKGKAGNRNSWIPNNLTNWFGQQPGQTQPQGQSQTQPPGSSNSQS